VPFLQVSVQIIQILLALSVISKFIFTLRSSSIANSLVQTVDCLNSLFIRRHIHRCACSGFSAGIYPSERCHHFSAQSYHRTARKIGYLKKK
jgi:hypothetical protein